MVQPWRVVSLPPLPAAVWTASLDGLPVHVVDLTELAGTRRDQQAVREAVADAEIVIGDWSGLAVDEAAVTAAPRLAAVLQPSAGVNAVAVEACRQAGIPVASAAGANAVAVAEWCLGATLACLRLLVVADTELRAGIWPDAGLVARGSRELAGSDVGIIGMGATGQALASRFTALGCTVRYWSRRRRGPGEDTGGAAYAELPELMAASEVVVVVIALSEQTRGLLDAGLLARLPAGAVLVNAGRGGIVDEDAVAAAVRRGGLLGAAFDVYAREPLPADSPLRGDPRILLSPHAAGATRQSLAAILERTVGNLRRAVTGAELVSVVNGAPPVVRRRG